MADAFERLRFGDEGAWKVERRKHIQASESAAIDGTSPWTTSVEIFDEKTGAVPMKDISDKPYVRYGKDMEPVARDAFMLDCPFFSLEYHQYDILVSNKRPWMGATLDGELVVTDPMNPWGFPVGTKGVYEGKTGSWRREAHLAGWDGSEYLIPPHYYSQGLHQLSVTGWDFVIFHARLKRDAWRDEDMGFPEIRTFYRIIDRRNAAVQADIRALEAEEEAFWFENIKAGVRPSRRIAI